MHNRQAQMPTHFGDQKFFRVEKVSVIEEATGFEETTAEDHERSVWRIYLGLRATLRWQGPRSKPTPCLPHKGPHPLLDPHGVVAGKPGAILEHLKRTRSISDTRIGVAASQARNYRGGDYSNPQGVQLQKFSQKLSIAEFDIVIANYHPVGDALLC